MCVTVRWPYELVVESAWCIGKLSYPRQNFKNIGNLFCCDVGLDRNKNGWFRTILFSDQFFPDSFWQLTEVGWGSGGEEEVGCGFWGRRGVLVSKVFWGLGASSVALCLNWLHCGFYKAGFESADTFSFSFYVFSSPSHNVVWKFFKRIVLTEILMLGLQNRLLLHCLKFYVHQISASRTTIVFIANWA